MADNKFSGKGTGSQSGKGFGGSSRNFGRTGGRGDLGFKPRSTPSGQLGKEEDQYKENQGKENQGKGKQSTAKGKIAEKKQAAKVKALQAAAKSVGIPLSGKLAGKIVGLLDKYGKFFIIGTMVMPMLMMVMIVAVIGGGDSADSNSGIAAESEVFDKVPPQVLSKYQSSANSFKDPAGNPLPWTIAFSIGAVASDHGRFSPYDECDRHPERGESALFPAGVPETYQTEDCDRIIDRSSNEDSPFGPFLFAPSYASDRPLAEQGELLTFEGSLKEINSLLEKEAKALAESEGYEFTKEFPKGEDEIAARDEFWAKVVSRLPIIPPQSVEPCETPQPAFSASSIAGAIRDTWSCELVRAGKMSHVVGFDTETGSYETEPGSEALDRIVAEALQVASAWSGFGAHNSTQTMCARTPIMSEEIGKPVVVIGDSLTVGADSNGLRGELVSAGASEVAIHAVSGQSTPYFLGKDDIEIPEDSLVVVALGTNDSVSYDVTSFKDNLTALRDKYLDAGASQVFLVNVGKVAGKTDIPHNAAIREVADSSSKATLINWSAWAPVNGVPYAEDGTHLTSSGYSMRSEYIASQLTGNRVIAGAGDDAEFQTPDLVNGKPDSKLTPVEHAGIFPLDEDTFKEFNAVEGASRCDFGPNIHAAAKAFIAAEQVPVEDRATERDGVKADYLPILGGWAGFHSVSDYNFAISGSSSDPTKEMLLCKPAIENWVNSKIAPQASNLSGLATTKIAEGTTTWVITPNSFMLSNPESPANNLVLPALTLDSLDGDCGSGTIGQTSPQVTDYAVTYARQEYRTRAAEIYELERLDDGEDPDANSNADDGIDIDAIEDLSIEIIYTLPLSYSEDGEIVEDFVGTPQHEAAQLFTLTQTLAHRLDADRYRTADQTDEKLTAALLPKFSSDGRFVRPSADVVPTTAVSATSYAKSIVNLATKVGGIGSNGSDSRASATPFADVPRLAGKAVTASSFLAIGGVPYALLDAVNEAIAAKDAIAPGCSIDSAFLLATAFAESSPWWDRIQPDGTMVDPLVNSFGAKGPFQFLQPTFDTYRSISDANGDGVSDVQNTYDAARASLKYQCDLLFGKPDLYGPDYNILDPITAWNVAVDYHDGPAGGKTREQCREDGEHLKSISGATNECKGEAYAQLRVDKAESYREMSRSNYFAFRSDPAYDVSTPEGRLIERAVTYAIDQVGKPYCRGSNTNCAIPFDELKRAFICDSGGCTLAPEPIVDKSGNKWDPPINLGPDSYDCSGLTYAAYYRAGMDLGDDYSYHQYLSFTEVDVSDIQPGDLIFYNKDEDPASEHVSMYIGSGLMVHAAGQKNGVMVQEFSSTAATLMGVTRPILDYQEGVNSTTPTGYAPTLSISSPDGDSDDGAETAL